MHFLRISRAKTSVSQGLVTDLATVSHIGTQERPMYLTWMSNNETVTVY